MLSFLVISESKDGFGLLLVTVRKSAVGHYFVFKLVDPLQLNRNFTRLRHFEFSSFEVSWVLLKRRFAAILSKHFCAIDIFRQISMIEVHRLSISFAGCFLIWDLCLQVGHGLLNLKGTFIWITLADCRQNLISLWQLFILYSRWETRLMIVTRAMAGVVSLKRGAFYTLMASAFITTWAGQCSTIWVNE